MIKKIGLGIFVLAVVFTFGVIQTDAALTVGALTITSSGALTLDGAATGNVAIAPTTTSGTIAIGVANTGGITIGNGDTIKTISIGAGNAVNTIHIGDHATPVNVITIGGAASSLALTDADWSITTAGAASLGTLKFKDFTEVVAATNVITAAESGSVFFLNHATEFVSTLPAPAAGLHFTFIVTGAPSGASYTVVTNALANIIKGQQYSSTGGNGDSGTADDTITFADGVAVAGDKVEVYSDGTSWFAYGFSDADLGITYTAAD